ncbi:MAG: heat shock protein DnaJ protein [Acidimicrobiales bacterium]|nr:heat shock protein DnaJ protein [Acidimicrobiales bacterium]
MAEKRDFYDVLGVLRTASQEEIQRAYRKLARKLHPDVNKDPGAEDRFKDVAEAYDILSDPDDRKRYDAFGHSFRQVPDDVDPETWARAQAGARAGGGYGGRRRAGAGQGAGAGDEGVWFGTGGGGGFQDVDIEDLFGGMFGGRGQRRGGWGPVAGADQEAEVVLTVEEAYKGGKRSVTLQGVDGLRTYEVDIPPGVVDGQRIRLAAQGGRGSSGAAPGDLYLVVRIAPHPRFRLEGRDIYVDLPLSPWEAALGTTVPLDTPGGEAKVRVNPGTSSGNRLRLRGRGMPRHGGEPGDLYAVVQIMVPPSLTDEERQLFEELARVSSFDPRRRR